MRSSRRLRCGGWRCSSRPACHRHRCSMPSRPRPALYSTQSLRESSASTMMSARSGSASGAGAIAWTTSFLAEWCFASQVGGAIAEVARTGQAARVDDYAGLDGPTAEHARRTGLRGAVAAPIFVDGRIWGALGLATFRRGAVCELGREPADHSRSWCRRDRGS